MFQDLSKPSPETRASFSSLDLPIGIWLSIAIAMFFCTFLGDIFAIKTSTNATWELMRQLMVATRNEAAIRVLLSEVALATMLPYCYGERWLKYWLRKKLVHFGRVRRFRSRPKGTSFFSSFLISVCGSAAGMIMHIAYMFVSSFCAILRDNKRPAVRDRPRWHGFVCDRNRKITGKCENCVNKLIFNLILWPLAKPHSAQRTQKRSPYWSHIINKAKQCFAN